MPCFSDSDINEAKRRVREMQSRRQHYTSQQSENSGFAENETNHNQNEQNQNNANDNRTGENDFAQNDEENPTSSSSQSNILSSLFKNGDSSDIIILVLIMVLSREGADNMLIFALLYLLL